MEGRKETEGGSEEGKKNEQESEEREMEDRRNAEEGQDGKNRQGPFSWL